MAGDWIPVRLDLLGDPAVLGIAARLGLTRYAAAGHLLAFWSWCSQQSRSGHARVTLMSHLDEVAGVTGFAEALAAEGWLEVVSDGIQIPHWDRWLSQSAKARALAAIRKRRQRHGDVTPESRSERDESVTTEDRREREEENPPLPPPGVPPRVVKPKKPVWKGTLPVALAGDRFASAWKAWLAYRRDELRKPVTQRSGDMALAELSALGAERAARAIEHTIARGWQGIREPEPQRNGRPGAGPEKSIDQELREAGLR